jgi:uncharacterized protein (UPF0248 family)
MARRKGKLEEIFSKALYADDPGLYSVSYRDFESIVQVSLLEFLDLSENFQLIPVSRIVMVSRDGKELYRKFSATVSNL